MLSTEIIFTAVILFVTFDLVAFAIWVGQQQEPQKHPLQEVAREDMHHFFMWKMFYVNPSDPRGWVPKRWGPGVTPNFRTRGRVKVFAGLVLVDLIVTLIFVLFVLQKL